ncbi:MAG: TolC family protein [Puniceicoccales bacterium]|jgi:outer membrane protein TolC|nr:TolC family protein [Puniceicoccales bacterium]
MREMSGKKKYGERFSPKLRESIISVALIAIISGCSSIDKSVSKSESDLWIPPKREEVSKQNQLKNYTIPDVSEILNNLQSKLDLPMLLDIAFENSPMTKKSWQEARIAAARNGKAASVFFPRVTVGGFARDAEVKIPGSQSHTTSYAPTIEIQYSIFQFGGHAKSAAAAKDLLYAANYQHNRELQTLARDVQKCYFLLSSAESAVDAANRNLDDAFVAYDSAFVKHQTGLASVQDFLRAKANRARAEFELENAMASVEVARANLARTIGVRVSDSLQITCNADENDIKDFDADIQSLIDETLKTRQDVLALHSIVKASKSTSVASFSKLAPELLLTGSGSRVFYRDIPGKFNNFTIGAAVQWTVFDGFYNVYDIVESRAKIKQAEQALRQLKLAIASDVWAKYHAFRSAIRQLNSARNYEQLAQESFDSVVISYTNGLSSFNDLMAAQTQLAISRQETVMSRNNLSMAIVDLGHTVGITNFEHGTQKYEDF